MTLAPLSQLPLALSRSAKTDVRMQFAALCYRMTNETPQILLVSSLHAKRWILPKGWPEPGLTPVEGVAREGWEEAGVIGSVHDQSIGLFSYDKFTRKRRVACVALLYPVLVHGLSETYPEAGRRRRRWFSRERAAGLVREPELAHLLKHFDPLHLRR